MAAFTLWTQRQPDKAVVIVKGEIDGEDAPRLIHAVEAAGRKRDEVELDLSRVTYMGAAAVRAVQAACQAADAKGFSLRVAALSPEARRVFEVLDETALLDCA